MAESRRYVLTVQGLPLFNQATPLNVIIPAMAGPEITVEVTIPVEFLAQSETGAIPAIYSPSRAQPSFTAPNPWSQPATMQQPSFTAPSPVYQSLVQPNYTAPMPLGTPGQVNPPISSPMASPGQQLNISSQQLALTPKPVSPGRQNSLTIPVTLSASASRASIPGEAPVSIPASPRLKPTPIPTGQSVFVPQSMPMMASTQGASPLPSMTVQPRVSPGEAFRQNPTLSKSQTPMSIADVLTSPQMLAPVMVKQRTAEPPMTMGPTCSSSPARSVSSNKSNGEEEETEMPNQDETEMVEGGMIPPSPQYRCPTAQEIVPPVSPSSLLQKSSIVSR